MSLFHKTACFSLQGLTFGVSGGYPVGSSGGGGGGYSSALSPPIPSHSAPASVAPHRPPPLFLKGEWKFYCIRNAWCVCACVCL